MRRLVSAVWAFVLVMCAVPAAMASNDTDTDGGNQEASENRPLPEVTQDSFSKGEKLFRRKQCRGCHGIGEFFGKCPDLAGVTERRTAAWLRTWLTDPDEMRKSDPIAKRISEEYSEVMPYLGLDPEEIEALLVYLRREGRPPQAGSKP